MFRSMRRKGQQLTKEECASILREGRAGVLAVSGDDGYPYAVPLNYVAIDGILYFHGAKAGHKLDAIRSEPKASFCVIAYERPVPEEFTTYYRSVIVFGRASVVDDEDEMLMAAEAMAGRHSPKEPAQSREREIRKGWNGLCIFKLVPEHISGKEAIELTRERRMHRQDAAGSPG